MAKPYGKNINLHKQNNKVISNQMTTPRLLSQFIGLNNNTQKNKFYQNLGKGRTIPRGGTTTSSAIGGMNDRTPGLNNPFYLYLLDNSIAMTSSKIRPGAATSISISNPRTDLGYDNMLRKGDTFWLYNRKTYQSLELTCDSDLDKTATSISIVSHTFKVSENFNSGSLIVPNYKKITQRVSSTPEFKRFDLTNSQYKLLRNNPYTLLSAESGKIHIPLSCTMILNYSGDEMTRTNLYIGHNEPSATIGEYWGAVSNAFYRTNSNQVIQVTPFTYGIGPSSGYLSKPVISADNNTSGLALKLYGAANFTHPSNTITVFLYYKTIVL